MSIVSGACQQLANFKGKQQTRRLLRANGCVGGGGGTATVGRRRLTVTNLVLTAPTMVSTPIGLAFDELLSKFAFKFKLRRYATGGAGERAAQRESMLNVTAAAATDVPASTTLVAGVAATAAQVLSDPCEASASARLAGHHLITFAMYSYSFTWSQSPQCTEFNTWRRDVIARESQCQVCS